MSHRAVKNVRNFRARRKLSLYEIVLALLAHVVSNKMVKQGGRIFDTNPKNTTAYSIFNISKVTCNNITIVDRYVIGKLTNLLELLCTYII